MHCSFRRWTTCCNWRNDEEFCSQVENPEEECLAIHLCSEAQLHLNYAAGQWCETEQSTSKWLKKIKYKILEWSRQSVHWNQIEMLWHYIKWAIYARKPSSVTEFKQFWKEEWTKIPPQWCERIFASYHKSVIAVLVGKVGKPFLGLGGKYLFFLLRAR